MLLEKIKNNRPYQYIISLGLIIAIALPCFFLTEYIGNKTVALMLLLAVSILAMLFDILPVMITAVFSALVWNFFFIPPLYKFHISTPEDVLLFLMYFAIAMMNAVLTSKIRRAEIKAKEKEEKENTIKLYNTLLNSLSHELRTPISTIIGAVDILKSGSPKLSQKDNEELLSEINIAGMRLNRQVENLLNMSRLESGFIQPQLDWCDMNELIYNVIQSFEGESLNHKIIFNSDDSYPLFKMDRVLIEQVLQNLVQNAILYTPEGTKIELSIGHDEKNCIIIVADEGPGFPENNIETVFDKFYRLPESSTGGTGLGLSIVKGFVEAHNGIVKLENKQGRKGAIFKILIPVEVSYFNELKNE
ncbi:MAG: PAS domain-containing sensor histidine kinase [Bacteroidales bacterium]|nr:PAS domain-containing sensor histidine kinase [Bacteroidales bacterium]